MLEKMLHEEDLPNNAFYGDGSPIEAPVLDAIREAYRQETVTFRWQEGDVLMLDNMLTAHGRRPFVGRREVFAGMAYRGITVIPNCANLADYRDVRADPQQNSLIFAGSFRYSANYEAMRWFRLKSDTIGARLASNLSSLWSTPRDETAAVHLA